MEPQPVLLNNRRRAKAPAKCQSWKALLERKALPLGVPTASREELRPKCKN